MIYNDGNSVDVPNVDLLTFLFESPHCHATEETPLHAEADDAAKVVTKSQARTLTKQFAYFLRRHCGVGSSQKPGQDMVVVVSSGQYLLPCLFFGVVAAGGVYSAASATETVTELARQIRSAGLAKAVVCSRDVADLAAAAAAAAGLHPQKVLVLESRPEVRLESVDGSVRCGFDGELAWRPVTDPAELENSRIAMLYSSGTTGLPKGVLISHANVVASAYISSTINRPIWQRWVEEDAAQGKDPLVPRTLAHLPPAHIAGLQIYFVNAFFEGGIVYWMPKFDFGQFVRYGAELRITSFFTVPPIYMGIAKHPLVTDQFASLRVAISGAAPLSKEIQAAASAKFGPRGSGTFINPVWGMSETTGAATHLPIDSSDSTGSIGELLPNIRMRLVDDFDRDVAPGQSGEALLKGPTVTKGYHNNAEANAAAFTADGWLRTGDVLRMQDGLAYIVDRKKELIKYKGLQVAPAELEGVLTSHPGIADAAVIGVPAQGTEVPRAYVVRAPPALAQGTSSSSSNTNTLSELDVVSFVESKVAPYKRLRGGVVFIPAIPRSASGKILRKDLRQMAARDGSRPNL